MEICVNWRAAMIPANSASPIFGQMSRVGTRRAVVKVEKNIRPGQPCGLALMLPKNTPEEPARVIEGSGIVVTSVLSAMQFHITLEWKNFHANGKDLLSEQISRQQQQKK